MEGNLPFFCFSLYLRAISEDKPPVGAYISRSDLTEGFFSDEFGELTFGGAYTWRGLFSEFYGIEFFRSSVVPGKRVLNKVLYGEVPPRGPGRYPFIYLF